MTLVDWFDASASPADAVDPRSGVGDHLVEGDRIVLQLRIAQPQPLDVAFADLDLAVGALDLEVAVLRVEVEQRVLVGGQVHGGQQARMLGLQGRHALVDAERLVLAVDVRDRILQDHLLDLVQPVRALPGELEVGAVQRHGLRGLVEFGAADLLLKHLQLARQRLELVHRIDIEGADGNRRGDHSADGGELCGDRL